MLLKDRCIGVLDLESPELDAFAKRDVEILTLLASQAAVAIENARLYETVRRTRNVSKRRCGSRSASRRRSFRRGRRSGFAGSTLAVRFASARELGGDIHDFLVPEPNVLVDCGGRCVGQGCAGRAVRRVRRRTRARRGPSAGGTCRSARARPPCCRRSTRSSTSASSKSTTARSVTPCSISSGGTVTLANSGLPYPLWCHGEACAQIELPGVPLGSFPGPTTMSVTLHTPRLAMSSCSARTVSSRR